MNRTIKAEQKRLGAMVRPLEKFSLGKNTGKNSGVEITVLGREDEQLGTIKIGSGSFEWWVIDAKKPSVHLDWYEFAALMRKRKKRRRL